MTNPAPLTRALRMWYRAHGRDLPWRAPGTTSWAVLVSEVMSQQTPVARVIPRWQEWMQRWPTPAALADASNAEILRAWDRLGYPRRALRLSECAKTIVERHNGTVPDKVDDLLALPGIGDYTARAVACFAFDRNVAVVDTNVRRVYARAIDGRFIAPQPAKRHLDQVATLLSEPHGPETSVALMELGALVCKAGTPLCEKCPIRPHCAWIAAGAPQPSEDELAARKKRVQKFEGTDRQVRGKIMAVLRAADSPVPQRDIDVVWPDAAQRSRALFSLLSDGLIEQVASDAPDEHSSTDTSAPLFQLPE